MVTADANMSAPLINLGAGVDLTIRELLDLVKQFAGYRGEIIWDDSKPDGTLQKLLEISRIRASGWSPKYSLEAGSRKTYRSFQSRYRDQGILRSGHY
jgi:GDP-L-fucose synthase